MKTAVLKFGGEVVADAAALAGVLRDVAALVAAGWRLVLCHGGGRRPTRCRSGSGWSRTRSRGGASPTRRRCRS
jgi:acetylglutamate kinase